MLRWYFEDRESFRKTRFGPCCYVRRGLLVTVDESCKLVGGRLSVLGGEDISDVLRDGFALFDFWRVMHRVL